LLAGVWLALDPIVKCTFVVVYQHLRSRREGDDLRGLLASIPREQQKKAQLVASIGSGGMLRAGLLLLAFSAVSCRPASAAAAQTSPLPSLTEQSDSGRDARIKKLRQSLEQESQRAIYRWHDDEHPSPPTWFDKLLAKIGQSIEHTWNKLWNFLSKLWPRGWNASPVKEKPGGWQLKDLRLWITVIAVVTLTAVGVLLWLRRRTKASSLSIPMAVAPLLDLSDTAAASERSEDEWFALAVRLEAEGDLRSALRAAYFALLAGLAQREWLTIRRDRTNREYLNEFRRRWGRRPHAALQLQPEVPEKLRTSLRQFDLVWYGMHAVTAEAVTDYRRDQKELLNHV
jgi:Domain of unknown function (DUF4129)